MALELFQPRKTASDRWSDISDASSTLPPPSRQSIKDEVGSVADILSEERSKDSVTIGIVREEGLERLEKACEYSRRWYKRKAPPMLFTTPERLQTTIDTIDLTPKHRTLNLLASPDIASLTFHVPSHFTALKILRCARHRDNGTLFVEGSSTYNAVRLDKWQAHRHKHHTLIVGYKRGVRIRVSGLVDLPHWGRCRAQFSDGEREDLKRHVGRLGGGWEEIKGAVAAIVGIVGGGVKLSAGVKGSAAGVYARYSFGMHALEIGAAGAKVAAVATAAGPAVVLGVAVGVAVYFIPWEGLFEWLKGALWCVWEEIGAIWERFKDWVRSLFSSGQEETALDVFPKPAAFAKK